MKKILLLLVVIIFYLTSVKAQASAPKDTLRNSTSTSDSIYLKPEIEAMYPGGDAAFRRYLAKHFIYTNEDIKGSVMVRFVVGKDIKPRDIQAIFGPGELKGDAIKMIQKSGVWMPGVDHGKMVASYKTVTIVFPNEPSN